MTNGELDLLRSLAGSNAGVITSSALASAGVSANVASRLVRRGLIAREFRGIYRLGYHPLVDSERRSLACAATGGWISHQSAARYWGFLELDEVPLHVTTLRSRTTTPTASWLVVHTTTKAASTITMAGVTVAKPIRTVLDLAGQPIKQEQLSGFVDHCIAQRSFTVRQLERTLRSDAGNLHGVARLRIILRLSVDADSRAEAELVRLLVNAGIEPPATQYAVRHAGHFIGRVDLAWPHLHVALELDGYSYHADHRTFVADRERGNRLVTAGWTLLRTTPAAMRADPVTLCRSVTAALAQAKAA